MKSLWVTRERNCQAVEAAIALAKEIAQDLSANQQPSYIRETAVVVTDEAGTELFRTPLKVDATSVRYDKSG